METTTIYASYGVLTHEYETVWGISPASEAYDEVTVKLPDGYGFCENNFGDVLVEGEDGDATMLSAALAKVADEPYILYPNPDGNSVRKVKLIVVKDEED